MGLHLVDDQLLCDAHEVAAVIDLATLASNLMRPKLSTSRCSRQCISERLAKI